MTNPFFKVFCGPMFASKTSQLLMGLDRLKYQKRSVAAFKPQIDERYDSDHIVTHMGWKYPAHCIKKGEDILQILEESSDTPEVIVVDELFMIPGAADALVFLFRNGFNIMVSSLDFAANGKPFPEVTKILPWATEIHKCAAVCTVCGSDAHYTHKKNLNIDEFSVEIGGEELYEPRCATHFHLLFDLKVL